MSHLEQKYLTLLSGRLGNYKVQKSQPFQANFRCPFCGDSAKNKRKARGYAYERDGTLFFSCHNCGKNTNGRKLIEHLDAATFAEYLAEKARERFGTEKVIIRREKPVVIHNTLTGEWSKDLVKAQDHDEARAFLERRLIPKRWWNHFWFTEDFQGWTNTLVPRKFEHPRKDPRVVITFMDRFKKRLIGYQGRTLGDRGPKYVTIKLDEKAVFGLDRFSTDYIGYVLEGPIDSTFVPNSLATGGMSSMISAVKDIVEPTHTVMVFDNEPRSNPIRKQMLKAIDKGYAVCVWPKYLRQKDVNDMVLAMGHRETLGIIKTSAMRGMTASLAIRQWYRG